MREDDTTAATSGADNGKQEEGNNNDDDGPPTCRICLCDGWVRREAEPGTGTDSSRPVPATPPPIDGNDHDDDSRLISPCLCSGSIRYVHVGCLNAWRRSAHGRSDSSFRCGQCKYKYKLRNTALALFLLGDSGAPTLAVAAILATVHVLGILGVAATTPAMRTSMYRWLRLGAQYRRGGGWLWLTETAYGEVVTVGGMALGCLFFTCSTAHRMMGKYAQYRRGMIGPEYFYRDLFFILCWIHNETQANGSGRGFAVVGFFMACYYSYDEAMRKAKHFAQMLGETILEPTAADRRRHTLEQQEQERGRGQE